MHAALRKYLQRYIPPILLGRHVTYQFREKGNDQSAMKTVSNQPVSQPLNKNPFIIHRLEKPPRNNNKNCNSDTTCNFASRERKSSPVIYQRDYDNNSSIVWFGEKFPLVEKNSPMTPICCGVSSAVLVWSGAARPPLVRLPEATEALSLLMAEPCRGSLSP